MIAMKNNRFFPAPAIAFFAALLLLLSSCGKHEAVDQTEYGLQLEDADVVQDGGPDQPSQEEILSQLNREAEGSKTSMTINTDPSFPDGNSEGDLFILCPESNQYPLVVQIVREDTDEALYTSGTLQPGDQIKYDRLAVSLSAGDYPCVAYYYALDKTGEICSTGAVRLTIHVQS